MSRNPDFEFVEADVAELQAEMVRTYEQLSGETLRPGSPENLMIQWVASIILQERIKGNYAANQNLPSRAEGKNLDALAELFYAQERPAATAATCTVRFCISEAQTSAVLIPAGTRVTDGSQTLYWETTADAWVEIGDTYTDAEVKCQTAGTVGNDYTPGMINTIVDVYDYYSACENTTPSDGGSEPMSDDAFYELLRQSMDSFSTAGARGNYIYHAMAVSSEIADVAVNSPTPGEVDIYALMNDGTIASSTMKAAILAACSAEDVRPLTDNVVMADPTTVSYDVTFTYYIARNATEEPNTIAEKVQAAVDEYVAWQRGKLGRDINPSKLISLLMATGIKRVALTSPEFTSLYDGSDPEHPVPQIAVVDDVTITNGGVEDE